MSKLDCVINMIREMSPENIQADTELIESGILSSLGIFEVVAELEDKYNIRIDPELIEADNFVTANTIVDVFLKE